MKKIYTIICSILLPLSIIAQVTNNQIDLLNSVKNNLELSLTENLPNNPIFNNSSSSNTIIWESDFSDPSDWTIDNGMGVGMGGSYGWTIDAVNDGWWSTNGITSTSGGNFAELSNGNAQQGNMLANVTYTMTTAQSINMSATGGNALLSFEEYGARFNDLQEVQVSTDGSTFTTVADNLDYEVLSANGGSPYSNPTVREIPLCDYIGSNPSTVWIRFSWTTNYPQSAANPNVWITYGWYIDDVKITEAPADAISMTDEVIGGWWVEYLNSGGIGQDYTFNPLSQAIANPYAFESVIKNIGTVQKDVKMYGEVFDGSNNSVFNTSSSAQILVPCEQDTFSCSSFFTPSSLGTYEIRMWSFGDSVTGSGGLTTLSDTAVKMTMVTDYEYGKDQNNPSTSYWRISRNSGGFEISSSYDIFSDADLYSVKAHISDWSVPGALVYAVLYEEDPSSSTPIVLDQTDDYTIQASDRGNWITLSFSSPITVFSGSSYRISIGGYLHPTDTAGINLSGSGEYSSDGLYDKDDFYANGQPTWYTIANIPMLRMSFDPATAPTSVKNIKQSICNIYPNPTNGLLTIDFDNTNFYDIKISNVLGQVVFKTKSDGLTAIDLSSLDKGIYTVNLISNGQTYSDKVIIE